LCRSPARQYKAFQALAEAAHKLKGGSGACGAFEVKNIAAELQQAATSNDDNSIAMALERLARALPKLIPSSPLSKKTPL
jgi:HPt (histidine-containing phosphotransfer) domain-containing protein